MGEYEKKFDELYLSPASENDGLSIAQMVKMAKDPNYLVRVKVAQDENVTEEILEQLVKDEDSDVYEAAFRNPNCPTRLLDEQLSLDKEHDDYNEDLLDIIYQHKNISFALALSYWADGDKKSRIDDLFKNNKIDLLENQEVILEYGANYPKILLAKNKCMFSEIVNKLVLSKNQKIKNALIRNTELNKKLIFVGSDDDRIIETNWLSKNGEFVSKGDLICSVRKAFKKKRRNSSLAWGVEYTQEVTQAIFAEYSGILLTSSGVMHSERFLCAIIQ